MVPRVESTLHSFNTRYQNHNGVLNVSIPFYQNLGEVIMGAHYDWKECMFFYCGVRYGGCRTKERLHSLTLESTGCGN